VPQIKKRKLSKNYLYDVEIYSSSTDSYMEASIESGRYKFLESPKLASSSTTVISEDENASVRSWREEFRVKIDSEQLTIPVTLMTLSFLELSFVR